MVLGLSFENEHGLMKTPNKKEEAMVRIHRNSNFVLLFFSFFFFSTFYFNEVLLSRQSNSLDILYYVKWGKWVIFCNYIFLAMCSFWAVTFFFSSPSPPHKVSKLQFAVVTIYNTWFACYLKNYFLSLFLVLLLWNGRRSTSLSFVSFCTTDKRQERESCATLFVIL